MSPSKREGLIGLLSFGFFILLFALFFVVVPDYHIEVSEFLEDSLNPKPIPEEPGISLPYPTDSHPIVYRTAMQFCLIYGVFQLFVIALRFNFKSSLSKVAETASNIVLWLGAAYMFSLLGSGSVEWFPFLGGIIVVGGFSIIVRSLTVLLFWSKRP
ncbi:MAG: hypothetical protein NWE81_02475 [Candidatus Bathyarchaeota archaeon]|nr:hypothetical protein [Candidatus Bathyarchaeota archaeon]